MSTGVPHVVVVIPTYNEVENLADVVGRVLAIPDLRVLVVDDNSPDGTGRLADSLAAANPRVAVIHRTAARGFGPAYLAGFRASLGAGADVVCQMDADGSHDPADLVPLLAALDHADVAQGSRYVSGSRVHDWPLSRRLLSRAGNAYVRMVMGIATRDATSGFRAYRSSALRRLPLDRLRTIGHGFQVELTQVAMRMHLTVAEVPISFRDRRGGESKVTMRVFIESLLSPWRIAGRHRTNAPIASDGE